MNGHHYSKLLRNTAFYFINKLMNCNKVVSGIDLNMTAPYHISRPVAVDNQVMYTHNSLVLCYNIPYFFRKLM